MHTTTKLFDYVSEIYRRPLCQQNAESEAHEGKCLGGWKGLLELVNFEVLAESVGTVTTAQSWR